MVRMQHEIKTLRAVVDTQDEAIKTLTSAKERLVKEKHKLEKELLAYKMKDKDGILDSKDCDSDDDNLYEALAHMLSKKHVTDTDLDWDLEAISHGDFRDVPQEDEELVSSFIASRSEKQLVQQMKRSLMATKNYKYVTINSVKRVTHQQSIQTFWCDRHLNKQKKNHLSLKLFSKLSVHRLELASQFH